MGRDKPLDELHDEHAVLLARFKEINDAMRVKSGEQDRLSAEVVRFLDAYDPDTGEEDAAVLRLDSHGFVERSNRLQEESDQLIEEAEETKAALDELQERIWAGVERTRTAAVETEKMMFEIAKLVATLDVGIIVAVAAVTPSLFPDLRSLAGLWPSFGWMLGSVAASILLCMFTMSNVSQLLANIRRKRSRLPKPLSRLVGALPYAVLLTLSIGGLLIGIGKFAIFVSMNLT